MWLFLHDVARISVPAFIPVLLGFISLSLAFLSVYLAIQNHRRKTGAHIRGAFTSCQSRDCDDDFVAEIILENRKDRAVTVFGIYIRIGFNLYLTLEQFEDEPLTLKPFETYVKSFGPIEFYVVNLRKIAVRNLLSNPNVKKRIYLSTSEGKYKVRTLVPRWSPTLEYFANHATGLLQPVRSIHNGRSIGSNVKFVIDFVNANDKVQTIPIRGDDYQLKLFRDFSLTRESLLSKEALEQYLHQMQEDGRLSSKNVVVYDAEAWRARVHDEYNAPPLKAEPLGFIRYYVFNALSTRYQNLRAARRNRRLVRHVKTIALESTTTTSTKEATKPRTSDVIE